MMGKLPQWAAGQGRPITPWPRRRSARWIRDNDLPFPAALFAAIPSLPRPVLARLTERMIDRMDELDGDPDLEATLEDDEPEQDVDDAHDDGCGPVFKHGLRCWGSGHDDTGDVVPIYGIDQTAGPFNAARHRPPA